MVRPGNIAAKWPRVLLVFVGGLAVQRIGDCRSVLSDFRQEGRPPAGDGLDLFQGVITPWH